MEELSKVLAFGAVMLGAVILSGAQDACPTQGELVVGDFTVLTSPNYPRSAAERENSYPPNSDCKWQHIGAADTLVGAKFLDLVMELGENQSNESCEFDYINITVKSETRDYSARRYCGYKKFEERIMGLGSIFIHFHSDDSVGYRGFRLGYLVTPEYDPCERNRCDEEKGTCVASEDGLKPVCECIPGISGEYCKEDIAECESDPCQNGGVCDDSQGLDHYSCDCPLEWEGDNCEIERIPECEKTPGPCVNGATCTDLPEFAYECECGEFFEGENCEIETGCYNPGIPYVDETKKYHEGVTLEFSCQEGFILVGDNSTKCLSNRTWDGRMPDCKPNITGEAGSQVITPLVGALGVLVLLFIINATIFVLWMKYRSPFAKLDEVAEPSTNDDQMETKIDSIRSSRGSLSQLSDDVFEHDPEKAQ